MISVEKFIKEYNLAKDKESFLSEHVVNKYVNYEDKIMKCKKNIFLSMYKTVNGKRIFWMDTPQQYLLFCLEMVASYTDIDMGKEGEIIKNYNLLNRDGLINIILSSIPESELSEFRTLLDMFVNDELENTRSLSAFFENKLEAFNLGADTLLSAFEEAVNAKSEANENESGNISEFKEV